MKLIGNFLSSLRFLIFISVILGDAHACRTRQRSISAAASINGAVYDEKPFMRPPDYDWFQAHIKANPVIVSNINTIKNPIRGALRNSAPLQGIVTVCSPYSATNTSSATQNTITCTFSVKSGTTIMISDCASAGCLAQPQTDQVIRLYNSAGVQVANGDDDEVCGKCAKIIYQVPSGLVTQTFSLRQGCYGHSSCTGTFTVSKVSSLSCPAYKKSFTSSATTNTSSCTFTACPGSSVSITDSNCKGSANDQFIRLYDTTNNLITSNDDASSSTRCSKIHTNLIGGNCQVFTLQQGCSNDVSCSGYFTVTGVATGTSSFTFNPSAISSSSPSIRPSTVTPSIRPSSTRPTYRPSRIPTLKPSSSKPTGIAAKTSKIATGVFTCNPFVVENTNDATTNTVPCTFTAPAGVKLLISDCSSTGCVAVNQVDQYIRLFDSNGNQVAFNDDDDDKICGLCSKITYSTPSSPISMQYTLQQGCKGSSACSGTFSISVLTSFTCDPYTGVNTLSASQNSSTCTFNACPGSIVSISGCTSTGCNTKNNDQYIRVLDQSGSVVAINDDGGCNFCSATTLKLSGTACQSYTLLQGCFGAKACSGQFNVDGISNPMVLYTATPTMESSIRPTLKPTVLSSISPSIVASNLPTPNLQTYAPTTNNIIIRCAPYSKSGTRSASRRTADCTFTAPAGVTLLIADCASSGCMATTVTDQYIRLYDSRGNQIAENDDGCGRCSVITYTTPLATTNTQTFTYTLKQGCYSDSECTGSFTVSISKTYVCPSFAVSNTNTALQNTAMCMFSACPGATVSINSCASTGCGSSLANDQYIRLYDATGTIELAHDDDSCGSVTGTCSALSYAVTGGVCRNFLLAEGCWASNSCSGQFSISQALSGSDAVPTSFPNTGGSSTQPNTFSYFPTSPSGSSTQPVLTFSNFPTCPSVSSTQPVLTFSNFPTCPSVSSTKPVLTFSNFPTFPSVSSTKPVLTSKPTAKPSVPTYSPTKPSFLPTRRPTKAPVKPPSKSQSPSVKPSTIRPTTLTPINPTYKPTTVAPQSNTPPPVSSSPVSLTPVVGYPTNVAGVSFNYNGGQIMTGNVNLYNVFYGDFSSTTSQQMISLVNYFAANIGGSSWYNMITTFYQVVNSVTTYASNSVSFVKSIEIQKTTVGGTLTEGDVIGHISAQITAGVLPIDMKGIYAFIFRGDVNFDGWVGSPNPQWCGYHGMFTYTDPKTQISYSLKFWLQGDPGTAPGGTGSYCSGFATTSYPNNNFGADTLVSVYAHELVEVVSDYEYAWYDTGFGSTRGLENADICSWTYGTLLPGMNNANTVIGGKYWLIQQNWIPGVGCRQQY